MMALYLVSNYRGIYRGFRNLAEDGKTLVRQWYGWEEHRKRHAERAVEDRAMENAMLQFEEVDDGSPVVVTVVPLSLMEPAPPMRERRNQDWMFQKGDLRPSPPLTESFWEHHHQGTNVCKN
jgi:hypothetical protein